MNTVKRNTPNGAYWFLDSAMTEAELPFLNQGQYAFSPVGKGRGEAWFVTPEGAAAPSMVMRHYRRGGLIGKLIKDSYWWRGLEKTRAWREWHLTAELYSEGFPVPNALAARVTRSGLIYRADLVTACIPNVKPFSEVLEDTDCDAELWQSLGALISRFHNRGVWHADLNAHNILLQQNSDSDSYQLFVIDLDRGEIRPQAEDWRESNLQRLRRSFDKIKGLSPSLHFCEENWSDFLTGYRAS